MFHHRRTLKRITAAKKKARSELNKCGWETSGFTESNRVELNEENLSDTIDRVDATNMSFDEFVEKYERPGIPVILTGIADKWQAWNKWTLMRLYHKYRNQKFKCGEDDDGYSVKIKMKYYVDYMLTTKDDSPLYIFDSSFSSRPKTGRLTEDYTVPHFFEDDLFRYASENRRPPYRWFVMGPARSGTGIHIDPLGTSAWNALIVGHKRWCLIHPSAPSYLVKPVKEETGKHWDEAIAWFDAVYPRIAEPTFYSKYPTIHAVQRPGDVMFVPSGWWHVVVNMDVTIAVTQNYCSLTNLWKVWPKTVKGRPKLSSHWLRILKVQRPEVFGRISQLSREMASSSTSLQTYSSDSSSSSSSSSESSIDSDEDSAEIIKPENHVKNDFPYKNDLNINGNSTNINDLLPQRNGVLSNLTLSSNISTSFNNSNGDDGKSQIDVTESDGVYDVEDNLVDQPAAGFRKRKLESNGKCNTESMICANKLRRSPLFTHGKEC